MSSYKLIHVIVPDHKASKVLKVSKKLGALGGTIYKAKGTLSDRFLNFFSIYNEKKELLIMAVDEESASKIVPTLVAKFNLEKKNTGIIFTTNLTAISGSLLENELKKDEVVDPMFKLITTIVDRGKAEDVVESANAAGARGGTILHARGSGSKETLKVFNMDIEPEKEVVMIIVDSKIAQNVVEKINNDLEINIAGKGIVFVQDIDQAHGIYHEEKIDN